MANLWAHLDPGLKWALGIVAAAILAGAVGLMYQRINKRMDVKAARMGNTTKAEVDASPASHSKEAERFLLRIARGPQKRQGPRRWRFFYNVDLGQYQLENAASDVAHDVKIDLFTNTGLKPKLVSSQTIVLQQLPPSLPAMLPLGAPTRAKDFVMCIRWDDLHGADQLERFRIADASFE